MVQSDAVNDFGYCEKSLYRKKKGEFFLYGKGNAASPFSRRCEDNCYGPGERIVPLPENEAKKFAEESLEMDEYEQIFGEV